MATGPAALHTATARHPAGVLIASGNRGERTARRTRLALAVIAPTLHTTAAGDTAGVEMAPAHGCVVTGGGT